MIIPRLYSGSVLQTSALEIERISAIIEQSRPSRGMLGANSLAERHQ